jgi:hypothetical protein
MLLLPVQKLRRKRERYIESIAICEAKDGLSREFMTDFLCVFASRGGLCAKLSFPETLIAEFEISRKYR